MKPWILARPVESTRGVMSTRTSAENSPAALLLRRAFGQQRGNAAERGADDHRLRPAARRKHLGERAYIGGEIDEAVAAVGDPFGIAVTAQVDRIGDAPGAGDALRRGAPGVPGLAAAMQQQHRRPISAEHVGKQADCRTLP